MRNFQNAIHKWAMLCFGTDDAYNKQMRAHRFLEEALELFQAADMPKADAFELIDYVYSRPKGELTQEVGGTMVTLAALCTAHGMCLNTCANMERARVVEKMDVIAKKHQNKPKFGALPE